MGRALQRSHRPLAGPWSLHVLLSGSVSTRKSPVSHIVLSGWKSILLNISTAAETSTARQGHSAQLLKALQDCFPISKDQWVAFPFQNRKFNTEVTCWSNIIYAHIPQLHEIIHG